MKLQKDLNQNLTTSELLKKIDLLENKIDAEKKVKTALLKELKDTGIISV